MKTIYLDQNKWIELAKRKRGSGGTDSVYAEIVKRVNNQEWCIPVSAVHLIETIKRADKRSRGDVLEVMAELSKGFSILSFSDVENAEVINAFAHYHDIKKKISFSPIKKYPFYAIGAIPALSTCDHLPSHIQGELHSILTLCMTDQNLFYRIISALESPTEEKVDSDSKEGYFQAMIGDREFILSKPKQYRYKIYLLRNILDVIKEHYGRLCAEFGLTRETFVPKETLKNVDNATKFLESMPSVDVRIKLNFDILTDTSYKFHTHDVMDISFLATAIPYTDIIVTERTWRHRVIKTKLNKKYGTVVLCNIEELLEE